MLLLLLLMMLLLVKHRTQHSSEKKNTLSFHTQAMPEFHRSSVRTALRHRIGDHGIRDEKLTPCVESQQNIHRLDTPPEILT